MGEEVKQANLMRCLRDSVDIHFAFHQSLCSEPKKRGNSYNSFRFSPVLCSEPKKRGNSYKKIFMEVIEHGMIG